MLDKKFLDGLRMIVTENSNLLLYKYLFVQYKLTMPFLSEELIIYEILAISFIYL